MKGGGLQQTKQIDPARLKDLESLAGHLQYALKNNAGQMDGSLINYVRLVTQFVNLSLIYIR
jgi:hypothetical protein